MSLQEQFETYQRDFPYREAVVGGRHWRYRAGGRPDAPTVLVLPGGTLMPDPLFCLISALGRQYRVFAPA